MVWWAYLSISLTAPSVGGSKPISSSFFCRAGKKRVMINHAGAGRRSGRGGGGRTNRRIRNDATRKDDEDDGSLRKQLHGSTP